MLSALRDYRGTVVFVAHDRYFMDALATRVAVVGGGGAAVYWGNYSDYLARQEGGSGAGRKPKAAAARRSGSPARGDAAGRREAGTKPPRAAKPKGGKNRQRERKRRWRAAFEAVADAEAAIDSLEARMAAPGFWEDRDGAGRIAATHADLQQRLPGLYEELARLDDEAAEAVSAGGSSATPRPLASRFTKQ